MARTSTPSDHPPAAIVEVDCSVLVPVLNEERHIAASIAAMQRQVFTGRLEFLIVDGGSTDRTAEIVAELARRDDRIRLLKNPRRGTPSGLNVALRHARGRWVARMDAHTEYPPDYLALGVERLRRGGTGWVSGPQVPRGVGPVSRAVTAALRTPLGRGASRKWGVEAGNAGSEYELDSGVFCGVWEREVVRRSGGWDEAFVRNQDSEMAGRFLARGERLICVPAMAATYTPRDSLRGLWRQYAQYGEFRARTARRHPGTLRRSALLPPGLVTDAAVALAGPRRARRLAAVPLAVYGVVLAGAALNARRDLRRSDELVLVPVVLATMHAAHGTGFLRGMIRHGLPVAALLQALGARRLSARFAPASVPVFAPSLDDADGAA